jgi:hypothetical protein
VLNTALPSLTIERVLVYKTVQPNITRDITLAYAKKFNVSGKFRWDTVIQSDDLRYAVEISSVSGHVRYPDQDRPE